MTWVLKRSHSPLITRPHAHIKRCKRSSAPVVETPPPPRHAGSSGPQWMGSVGYGSAADSPSALLSPSGVRAPAASQVGQLLLFDRID